MEFTESEKAFLELKFCPVCQQELQNLVMCNRELSCPDHGTFVVTEDKVIWEA